MALRRGNMARASLLLLHVMALTVVGGDVNSTTLFPPSMSTTVSTTSYGLDSCDGVTRCLNDTHCAQCISAINATRGFVHTEAQFLSMRQSVAELREYELDFFDTLLSTSSCWSNTTSHGILFPALQELGNSFCVGAHGMYTDTCSIAEYVISFENSFLLCRKRPSLCAVMSD